MGDFETPNFIILFILYNRLKNKTSVICISRSFTNYGEFIIRYLQAVLYLYLESILGLLKKPFCVRVARLNLVSRPLIYVVAVNTTQITSTLIGLCIRRFKKIQVFVKGLLPSMMQTWLGGIRLSFS